MSLCFNDCVPEHKFSTVPMRFNAGLDELANSQQFLEAYHDRCEKELVIVGSHRQICR